MTAAIASRNWTAFHDHMPGRPVTLRVQGTVAFPSSGYEITLTLATPPGINTRILELDWHEKVQRGSVLDMVTWIPVRSELATSDEFEEVHVRGLGQMIEVFCVY